MPSEHSSGHNTLAEAGYKEACQLLVDGENRAALRVIDDLLAGYPNNASLLKAREWYLELMRS